jgi:two-component system NtrC family sensor kinase
MNALLGSSFTLLVVALILYRSRRQKQKAKKHIEEAYDQLQATQSQLIQSEKMASLGELTAGIAHEIQNPLNFVNNFSEVNRELLEELLEELDNGNKGEIKNIAADIIQNEEKINHHGRRAESIVKNMLLHSRGDEGQKVPTDINAMMEEYTNLAFHGMRAREKSFQADYRFELDNTIPPLNVVPQDIGRVILNLVNNAFYAVSDAQKNRVKGSQAAKAFRTDEEMYRPEVVLRSKMLNGKVEISVQDNGEGIPEHIRDKIFQPFFTTKHAGQGTGLGLSLSYDIIKAHGGELKVETIEREGSNFIITLPANS